MNWKKSLGAVSFLIGIVLILNAGSGITGFVISENISPGVSSFLGILFIIASALLFVRYDMTDLINEDRAYGEPGARSTELSDQRDENLRARLACSWKYEQKHGRSPEQEELREFMAPLHRKKQIPGIVREWKRREK